jgi:pimeloyl-ACP methyl ester carboxylesterase
MATFVLVAGACCGGWSWNRVAPALRAAGHEVHTPTLTGLGDRVHLASADVDLETHVTDVVNLLFYEDLCDVTLVGYSYGGIVIAGVADRAPERLAQLVYGDADVPEDGQSGYDCGGADETERAADRAAAEAADTPGFLPVPVDYLRAEISDAGDRAWVLARTTPHPLATFAQPVRLRNPAAAALPRAYVFCTQGKVAGSSSAGFAARYRSAPGWRYREIAANHMAPVTAPRALADAFLSLV